MQMPIPQRAPRGSPETDKRQASPACITAAATLDPACTPIIRPFTEIETCSDGSIYLRSLTTIPIVADCILRLSNPHDQRTGRFLM
jgi:hypothetical protein